MRCIIFLSRILKDGKKSSLRDEEIEIWSTAAQGCWDSNPVLQTHLLIQQHTTSHGEYGLVRKTGIKTFPRKVKKYLGQKHFADRGPSSQGYGFSSSHVWMCERRRIDAFELWCWRRFLRVPWTARRFNQSVLKEISPEYSLEGLMLKLKLQYFGQLT